MTTKKLRTPFYLVEADLVGYKVPEIDWYQTYDEAIKTLHDNGLNSYNNLTIYEISKVIPIKNSPFTHIKEDNS